MGLPDSTILALSIPAGFEDVLRKKYADFLVTRFPLSDAEGFRDSAIRLVILGDDLDGFDTLIHQLRQTEQRTVPILAVSRNRSQEELLRMGVDTCIRYSDSPELLLLKTGLLLNMEGRRHYGTSSDSTYEKNPYFRALQSAARLIKTVSETSGPTKSSPDVILLENERLVALVARVEQELNFEKVIHHRREHEEGPEGLEFIDVQAYIGEQISPGERIESDAVDKKVLDLVADQDETGAVSDAIASADGEETKVYPDSLKHQQDVSVHDALQTRDESEVRIFSGEEMSPPKEPMGCGVEKMTLDTCFDSEPEDSTTPPGVQTTDATGELPSTSGDLKEDAVWDILAMLLRYRSTGSLTLDSGPLRRVIYLENGDPTIVISNAREDRLVELLYREGRISEQQYQNASLTIGGSGRRAGVVMVEKGVLLSRELFPTIRHHYETMLFDCFTWSSGEWRFVPGEKETRERIQLDVSGAFLVVEGLRTRGDATVIERIVPEGSSVRCDGISPEMARELGFRPEEVQILEWCNGFRSTQELARRFEMDDLELRAFLSGLVVIGMVSLEGSVWKGKSGGVTQNQMTVNALRLPDIHRDRRRVMEKYEQVLEGTYYAILDIEPDAPVSDIRNACQRLTKMYDPNGPLILAFPDLHHEIVKIAEVLKEAQDVLSDSVARDGYRRAIEKR